MIRILQTIKYHLSVICLCIALVGCASAPNDPPKNFNSSSSTVGVVFLHAKWAEPHSVKVAPLIDEMRLSGIWVVQPELPWSRKRNYDVGYEEVMLEIHAIVNDMHNKAVTKVFVGGHSFGANAAIGYAARYSDVDGVIAIAPGHLPDINARGKIYGDDVERAQKIIDGGRGDEPAEFIDVNQGKQATVIMSARNYISYFKPDGPAIIPLNIRKMNKKIALFWVVGENDKISWMGKHYAYNKAPFNEFSEYLETTGGHRETPNIAKHEVIEWIKKVTLVK